MAKAKKNNIPARDKLKSVTPSGKKEESFFALVYQVVRQIPRGRVTSYGAIAKCLGTKSSARMVGWALNGSHNYRFKIPAHRVVNRNGILSGKHHFNDPGEMERLLLTEKVKVVNDKIEDFEKIFWDPCTQL